MAPYFFSVLLFFSCFSAETLIAQGFTNLPVYVHPFDLAGGGSIMTRATRDGILFSNPAELPVAGIGFRWLGLQTGLFSDSSLLQIARDGVRDADDIILALRDNPINYGISPLSFSFFTSNAGISLFAELSVDLELDDYADNGLPGIDYDVGGVGGGVGSLALSLTRWFSLGATLKYLYASREKGTLPLLDPSAWEDISEASFWLSLLNPSQALGVDVGSLLSFRGSAVDLDIAFTARDIGSTTTVDEVLSLKQTLNAGIGVELHGTTNTMHISCDYNDIENVNQQPTFKQLYCGTKILLFHRLGIAAGYFQGSPSYGLIAELPFINFGVSHYVKERGVEVGQNPRSIYSAYLGLGI